MDFVIKYRFSSLTELKERDEDYDNYLAAVIDFQILSKLYEDVYLYVFINDSLCTLRYKNKELVYIDHDLENQLDLSIDNKKTERKTIRMTKLDYELFSRLGHYFLDETNSFSSEANRRRKELTDSEILHELIKRVNL